MNLITFEEISQIVFIMALVCREYEMVTFNMFLGDSKEIIRIQYGLES
jgi:hypothetical protein